MAQSAIERAEHFLSTVTFDVIDKAQREGNRKQLDDWIREAGEIVDSLETTPGRRAVNLDNGMSQLLARLHAAIAKFADKGEKPLSN